MRFFCSVSAHSIFSLTSTSKTSWQSNLFLLLILSGRLVCFPLGTITASRSVWAPYIPALIPTPQIPNKLQSALLMNALKHSQAGTCSSLGQLPVPWDSSLSKNTTYRKKSTETHSRVRLSQLASSQMGICRRIILCTAGSVSNPASGTSKQEYLIRLERELKHENI